MTSCNTSLSEDSAPAESFETGIPFTFVLSGVMGLSLYIPYESVLGAGSLQEQHGTDTEAL